MKFEEKLWPGEGEQNFKEIRPSDQEKHTGKNLSRLKQN